MQNMRYPSQLNLSFWRALMNRRKFLKLCGLAACGAGFGFGTTGCAIPPKDVNWKEVPDSEFTIQKFNDWFIAHKLYNGVNPNLKIGQRGYGPTFEANVFSRHGATPGIDYNSNNMYAIADGVVFSDIRKIGGSGAYRLGGLTISIAHGQHTHGTAFSSKYSHIGGTYVKQGDHVKRGDLIAVGADAPYAKLTVQKHLNYIDPDNYGPNHSYMNYYDGVTIYENENIEEKDINQRRIVANFLKLCKFDLNLDEKMHRNMGEMSSCMWDQIEIFRYLQDLYIAKPKLFPKLEPDSFSKIKNEFYANQPITFTLPLKE
jgi:hypothetical protein